MPPTAAIARANVSASVSSPPSSSSPSSSSPLDPALRALAASLASPKASSVFLANARRNFTAEALAIQKEYGGDRKRRAALLPNRTSGSASSPAATAAPLALPRPSTAAAAAATQTSSFAASGRLPATYGISETAMEPATQQGYEACSITLSADPPSASACSPVTLTARVLRPGPHGAASGVVVFGDNGVALGPPIPLDAGGAASVTVTSLLPGKHNLVAWYLRGNAPGASCNEGFSAPLAFPVARAPALVTVRASPASLASSSSSSSPSPSSSSSNDGSVAANTCSLKSVAFDVAVGAPGGVRDCATPGGVVALYLVRGRLSGVGSWSGPLLLQARESLASASAAASASAGRAASDGASGAAPLGPGVFRSQAKRKATDALMGAATSAANSVARIFAKQVLNQEGGGSGEGGIGPLSSASSSASSSSSTGGISVGGLDLGRAVASAKAAAAALSAVSGGGGTEKDGSSSTSSAFAGLPAPLASAVASHLASQRPSNDDAREAAKTVVSAAASDDESAEIAARAIDAVAAAAAADDRRVQERTAAAAASGSSSKSASAPAAPDVATSAAAGAAATTTTTATPTLTASGGGGLLSHLPHLLPSGGIPLPHFGRRSRRSLQDWTSDIQAAVAADPLLHRVLGAGLLLPTELAPGAPAHAALGAAKLKFGITPPGQYTLVAQYSGDSRFEKASGIVPFDIDASCGFFT